MYNYNGNILQKDDVNDSRGEYGYGTAAGSHVVTSVSLPKLDYLEHAKSQTIEYTTFNKTKRINQFVFNSKVDGNNYTYAIEHGSDYARKTSVLFKDYKLYKYKHYVGNYEVEFDAAGNKRELNYISGGDGLFAIYVKNGDADTMYYVHKDHLGSLYCDSDEQGSVVETEQGNQQYFSFDPWGRHRNPTTWSFDDVSTSLLFNRGFTGHEHLDLFGLINMNGRTYDPWLGRMLQPDNFVQASGYSQNFNRYSYAYNNPLKFTDPDGEWIHIAVGAAIGGVLNLGINAMQGNIDTFGDGFYAFGIGAAAGALTVGVGAALAGNAAAGGGFGGLMATLDAISSREHWFTGSPYKKYAFTDGKNTMTQGAAAAENTTSTKINASVKLPKTYEPYGIEVEAPKGWEIISGKSTFSYGDAAIEVSQTFSGNNSMCVEFPIGTPNGGGYAAHIQSPINLSFQGNTNIFYPNGRSFSTLFWYLRLF